MSSAAGNNQLRADAFSGRRLRISFAVVVRVDHYFLYFRIGGIRSHQRGAREEKCRYDYHCERKVEGRERVDESDHDDDAEHGEEISLDSECGEEDGILQKLRKTEIEGLSS